VVFLNKGGGVFIFLTEIVSPIYFISAGNVYNPLSLCIKNPNLSLFYHTIAAYARRRASLQSCRPPEPQAVLWRKHFRGVPRWRRPNGKPKPLKVK